MNLLDKVLLSNAIITFYFQILIDLYLLYFVFYVYYDNSMLLNLIIYFLLEYKILKNKFNTIFCYSDERYKGEYFRSLHLLFNYFYYYILFDIKLINELNIYQLVIGTTVNLIFAIFY